METLFLILKILGVVFSYIILFFVYEFIIVPLHMRSAAKMGCGYDPRKNEFTHGPDCKPHCWCQQYKDPK